MSATTAHHDRRRRLTLTLGWAAVGVLAVVATWMGGIAMDLMLAVMSVVSLLGGDFVLPFEPDWIGMAYRLAATGLAIYLAWRVIRYRRISHGACGRCGRTETVAVDRQRLGKRAAWISVLPAAGYAVLKLNWAFGGTLGLADTALFDGIDITSAGFADTAAMAGIGIGTALAMAYRRPRLPRWLLLTPALIGCGMLVPVSILGTIKNVTMIFTSETSLGLQPWVFWFVYSCFLVWGACLVIATAEYHYATRARCRTCGRGGYVRIGG